VNISLLDAFLSNPIMHHLDLLSPRLGGGDVLTHVCQFVSSVTKKHMGGFSWNLGNR